LGRAPAREEEQSQNDPAATLPPRGSPPLLAAPNPRPHQPSPPVRDTHTGADTRRRPRNSLGVPATLGNDPDAANSTARPEPRRSSAARVSTEDAARKVTSPASFAAHTHSLTAPSLSLRTR